MNANELTELFVTFALCATFGVLLIHLIMAQTLWGYRRRGVRDAKTGAARPYETGWTSPFIEQQVQKYENRLARLTCRAEHRLNRSYQKVTALVAEIEKLDSRKKLLAERYENPVMEEEIPEIRERAARHFYQMVEHIAHQQADLSKKMSKLRAHINTKRQKYLEKKDSVVNARNERINAYWGGVAQRLDDSPVAPEYDDTEAEAFTLYITRNDHVLAIIDHYTGIYLDPDDSSTMQV